MAVNPWELIQEIEGIQDGIGDWVASGTPATAMGQAIQQRMRDRCDEWSNAPGWIGALSPIGGATIDNVCNPWLVQNGSGGPSPTGGLTNFLLGKDLTQYGGVTITYMEGGVLRSRNVVKFLRTSNGSQLIWWNCGRNPNGDPSAFTNWPSGGVNVTAQNVCSQGTEPLPSVPGPNPNPRPLPPPSPDDEPYTKPGEELPRIPLPPISGPIGVEIELPDFTFPGEASGSTGYDPTAPVNPGTPSTGEGSPDGGNPDEDFGAPPDGEVWVGFTVELLNQSRTQAGFIPSAQPETVYAQPVGGVYPLLDIGGETVVGPYVVVRNLRTTWLSPNLGLNLKGARVHLKFQGTQYEITPLSQPKGDA